MCCQVQYHQINKWVKDIVIQMKAHFTCPSISIEFIFLVEIIFLKLGFYGLNYNYYYYCLIGPPPLHFSPSRWWSDHERGRLLQLQLQLELAHTIQYQYNHLPICNLFLSSNMFWYCCWWNCWLFAVPKYIKYFTYYFI